MSMLTLNGTVINVFQAPKGVNKEGKEYGGQDRVQVMAENLLQNGEKRVELIDLTVEDPKAYATLQGKRVRVPVGVFVAQNAIRYFVPKGSKPEVSDQRQVAV